VVVPAAVLLGAVVAYQFFHLTPRYVKLIFGLLFLLAVTRLPFHLSMSMFLIIFPAPTFVFIGDTNVIFLGLMSVIWFLRVSLGRLPRRISSPVDWAILIYLGLHAASFLNIQDRVALDGALWNMQFMIAGAVMYFLLVQAIRTEEHLSAALKALCWTAVFVDVTAIAEYYFGIRIVPRWFIFTPAQIAGFGQFGRAGGVFGFHGLLADFCAMSFYIQITLGLRAKTRRAKLAYYTLAALSILNILNSANRGGAVIWILGGIYYMWFRRREIRWTRLIVALPLGFAVVAGMGIASEKVLSRVRLITRLAQTQLVRGIPANRVIAWRIIVNRLPEHLFLGHGPYIDLRRGITGELYWPHNAYLFYLYTTGVTGLLSYLWILGKIIWLSFPRGGVSIKRDSLARVTQAIFHLQVVLFALGQIRDEHQRGNVYIYYMWILFAFAVIGQRMARQEREAARAARAPQAASPAGGPALPGPANLLRRGGAFLRRCVAVARYAWGGCLTHYLH